MANTTGGRVTLTINGVTFSTRGTGKVSSGGVEIKVEGNNDGTVYRTVKNVPVELEIIFDRGQGCRWDAAMMLAPVAATYQEIDATVTHIFASASFTGKPEINSETGEVTGLKIATNGASYTQLQG